MLAAVIALVGRFSDSRRSLHIAGPADPSRRVCRADQQGTAAIDSAWFRDILFGRGNCLRRSNPNTWSRSKPASRDRYPYSSCLRPSDALAATFRMVSCPGSRVLVNRSTRAPNACRQCQRILVRARPWVWSGRRVRVRCSARYLRSSQPHQHFKREALLLVAYAVGAAVPMLAIAYGGQLVTTRVKSRRPRLASTSARLWRAGHPVRGGDVLPIRHLNHGMGFRVLS